MSFSQQIKNEILENLSKFTNQEDLDTIRFSELLTESNINSKDFNKYRKYINISNLDEYSIKLILKSIYLASGCVVDPNLNYHFEIIFKHKASASYILNVLNVLDFTPRLIKRNTTTSNFVYVIYIKDSEQISKFLSIIEANGAMLKLEEIKVEKEVKNNINRTVNCETANIKKVIATSVNQIEAINKLKKFNKFNSMPDRLKTIANLRTKHSQASLEELATIAKNHEKISKSGVKHRLDKIIELSQELD